MDGGYYLHENGSLIHKSQLDIGDMASSTFVKDYWFDYEISRSPDDFVHFLFDAKTKGANNEDIFRLANHNHLENYIPEWKTFVGIE